MLLVTPPTLDDEGAPVVAREVIFVIDSSGSMHGDSMEQAKSALSLAIARLRPSERFNVVDFDSAARALFPAPVLASADQRSQAAAWVSSLHADGGTEMTAALDLTASVALFAFLREVTPGNVLELEGTSVAVLHYRVADALVVDEADVWVLSPMSDDRLTLITCWPFDAVVPGGRARYVVRAQRVPSTDSAALKAGAAPPGTPRSHRRPG